MRKGIIYTTDIEKGKQKLEEIIEKKKARGIYHTIIRRSMHNLEVTFSDNTHWKVAMNFESVRGLRWVDAYIDLDISIRFLNEIIMPKRIRDMNTNEWGEVHYF